jgi:hypothetical protein
MSAFVRIAGGILIIDGVASIKYSTDQSTTSNAGRVLRTAIGIGLMIFG